MKLLKHIKEKITGSNVNHDKGFLEGWIACLNHLNEENAELKEQLEIAKEALNEIKFAALQGDETSSEINCYHFANDCLLKLETTGE